MKIANIIKSVVVAGVLGVGSLMSPLSFAGADDGVKCPSGYDAQFSGGVLKCSKVVRPATEIRNSVCPLLPFVTTEYFARANAVDKCKRFDNGQFIDTVIDGIPVLDPQNWQRQIDGASGSRDRFVKLGAPHTEYAYPAAVNLL